MILFLEVTARPRHTMSQLLFGAAKAEIEALRNDLTPGELAEERRFPPKIFQHTSSMVKDLAGLKTPKDSLWVLPAHSSRRLGA